MTYDQTKDRIRRRRYADLRQRGEPIPPDLASHFVDCELCKGRGTMGYATIQVGRQVEIDDVCADCAGQGFVQVSSVD